MRHEGRITFSCPMLPNMSVEDAENKIINAFKAAFGDEYDMEFDDSGAETDDDTELSQYLKTYIAKALKIQTNGHIICVIDEVSNCIAIKNTDTNGLMCICNGQAGIICTDHIDLIEIKTLLTKWNIAFDFN